MVKLTEDVMSVLTGVEALETVGKSVSDAIDSVWGSLIEFFIKYSIGFLRTQLLRVHKILTRFFNRIFYIYIFY